MTKIKKNVLKTFLHVWDKVIILQILLWTSMGRNSDKAVGTSSSRDAAVQ